ncbi:putative receptor-like protein kinase [Iris pallida]|uniref:Receptor-like protein kinase n=1 Tax=Iris pallida TaxID=29817 RepID=A0AAX6EGU6_IRIPA|nr:putative receptor-like protein kinase [Iris pallida]
MKMAREANGGGGEEEVGNTIVVGVKMDQQSKEILTWALIKIAQPGDRVVALNVLPSSSSSAAPDPAGKSQSPSGGDGLESMLAVYEGFCNLKQIDLKLKVCKGSSMRRILVREVTSFGATQLILGATKTRSTIGPSSTSVAKYCAKKLPRNCSVVAVCNGKIVFQREATESNRDNGSSCIAESECVSVESFGASSEPNCVICASPSVPPKSDELKGTVESAEASTSSDSPRMRRLLETRPGWSLLRRSVLTQEPPKVSMVQWAMQLPARYSTSSLVHPNRKHKKTNSTDTCSLNGERESSSPSLAVHDEESRATKEMESLRKKYSPISQSFSYKELVDATSNFSSENLIGKGGSSRVYKGCSVDGKQLAVKILKPSEDAVKEFVAEIEILTTLNHKNIVSICGFCFEKDHLILVYEYLSKGCLEENLHGVKEDESSIGWAERYQVAIGVAQALDYLHDSSRPQPVIHKDVKSSNILISDDFEPKLSDFGLATWASASQSLSSCSDVAGTFGYLAPEYFMFGRVNEKIDVYAYGVVLLELLSGKKPISAGGSHGQKSLVLWASKANSTRWKT